MPRVAFKKRFIHFNRDTQAFNQQEDPDEGIRRSTRERKLPQIYIQSSILNPNVLRPRSKASKKVSDAQSGYSTVSTRSSSKENVSHVPNTRKNKRRENPSVENVIEHPGSGDKQKENEDESQSKGKKRNYRSSVQVGASNTNNNKPTRRGRKTKINKDDTEVTTDTLVSETTDVGVSKVDDNKANQSKRGRSKSNKNNTEVHTDNTLVSETTDSGVSKVDDNKANQSRRGRSKTNKNNTEVLETTNSGGGISSTTSNKSSGMVTQEEASVLKEPHKKDDTMSQSKEMKEKRNLRSNSSKSNDSKSQKFNKQKGKNNKTNRDDTGISETIDSGVCCVSSTLNNPGMTLVHENIFAQPTSLNVAENVPIQPTLFNTIVEINSSVESMRNNSSGVHRTRSKSRNTSVNANKNITNNSNLGNSTQQSTVINPATRSMQNEITSDISKEAANNNAEIHCAGHDNVTYTTSEGTIVNNLEMAQIIQDSAIPNLSDEVTNHPEMILDLNARTANDTQGNISRKRSVTFLEPPIPKPKKKKLAHQKKETNLDTVGEVPTGKTNSDEETEEHEDEEEKDEHEEELNTSNVLHTVINNEVISCKWKFDAPVLTNCEKNVDVKYTIKNMKSSWGETSWGYMVIKPKQKKPLNVVRKHNITFRVERGHGIIIANRKKQIMNVGNLFYLPLGVEYALLNLLDEPLVLLFQKATP